MKLASLFSTSSLGSHRRLSNLVTDLSDLVQRRVRPETELGPGNVVTDRRRENDHRDSELGKFASIFWKHEYGVVSTEAADKEEAADVVSFQLVGNFRKFAVRQWSFRAQESSTLRSPSVDGFPRHRFYVPGDESV